MRPRRLLPALATVVSAALIAWAAAADSSSALVPDPERQGALRAVHTPCPWVALTFDDGPDPTLTPTALEALADAGAGATFFMVGAAVARHPDVVRQVAAAGHELANHTWSHRNLVELDDDDIGRELRATHLAISATGATASHLVRPPRGRLDARSAAAARDAGWEPVSWNASPDPLLKAGLPPDAAADRVTGAMGPGAVVLFHDSGPAGARSTGSLPALLEGLARRGLRGVSLGDLITSSVTGTCEAPAPEPVSASAP